MINYRRLGLAAAAAACAALGVLGAGSSALASSHATSSRTAATTTSQIKACYKTSISLSALAHIADTSKCPSGYSTLTWNNTGPQGPAGPAGPAGAQGPAGVSTGISGASSSSVTLNTSANNFDVVMKTAPAPVTGTYFASAEIMTYVTQGDGIDCIFGETGGPQDFSGEFADNDPVAGAGFQTLPLAQSVSLVAGESLQVYCGDYTSSTGTYFYDGGVTASLINTATSSEARQSVTGRPLSPRH